MKLDDDNALQPGALRAEGLAHSFSGREVLSGADIEVRLGEIVGLRGPSGVGKSTLGRALAGRFRPDAGAVTIGGRRPEAAEIAYVGQAPRDASNPTWTLERIIAEPLAIAAKRGGGAGLGEGAGAVLGVGRGEASQVIREAASAVLLDDDLLSRRPGEVSDGQLQRAVLARGIVQRPAFFVCDEPTSMLDPITTAAIIAALRSVVAGDGAGVLLISHDVRLLRAVATRGYVLRDGRAIADEEVAKSCP